MTTIQTSGLRRTVLEGDAINWCREHRGVGPIITSPPDAAELGMDLRDWRIWYSDAVSAAMSAAGRSFPAIFCATDRKVNGVWVSKADIIHTAADWCDLSVIWHKIVLRRDPGKIDLHRPGYSHLICVADARKVRPGMPSPDVIPPDSRLYPNGMPRNAAWFAANYASHYASVSDNTIYNPFCGRGTVLLAAEAQGCNSFGIDNDPTQVQASRLAVWK